MVDGRKARLPGGIEDVKKWALVGEKYLSMEFEYV